MYIATPHTMHFQQAKAAILARKHVLCEKPFTTRLAELEELVSLARSQGVFLMESAFAPEYADDRGVWTRFHPITYAVCDLVHSGRLGTLKRVTADLGMDMMLDCKRGFVDVR